MIDAREALSSTHDVVIVGAGLAGLSAAYQLRGLDTLLLEREPRIGGRVLTCDEGPVRVDLGACFAFNPAVVPADVPLDERTLIRERGPLGIHAGGVLHFSEDAWGCLERLSLPTETRASLEAFRDGRALGEALSKEAYALVNAFFKQIHPGEMRDYGGERQKDALAPLFPDHWISGNRGAVDAFADRIQAPVKLGCEVTRVEDLEGGVEISYRENGQARKVGCRAAILATPATAARGLITPRDPACRSFLSMVRYGRYTVVALVLEGAAALAEFRYIVTPELRLTLVMQQGSSDRHHRTLLCYYDDEASPHVDGLADAALIEATKGELLLLGIPGFDPARIVFSKVQRWALAGTVISAAYAAAKEATLSRATEHVYLAGDYLCTPGWGYGMDDAVKSGADTGALVGAALAAR